MEVKVTEVGMPLIECGTVARLPLPGCVSELVLTPDAARELALRLTRIAHEMDGLTYRQWKARKSARRAFSSRLPETGPGHRL